MSLDELVYDSTTPAERKLLDLESRFYLMCLAPSRRDLVDFYTDRFDIASVRAKANFEVLRSQTHDDATRLELDQLSSSLIETLLVVEEMAGGRVRGPDIPWLIETVKHELEDMAQDLLHDASMFRSAIDSALSNVDREQLPLLERSLKVIREAISEIGLERQEMLRDARAYLHDLLGIPGSTVEPVLWFYQGWLSWMRHLDPEEVRELFFRACLGGSKRKDVVFWLSCRHLAFIQSELERPEDAYIAIRQALGVRTDAETLVEAVRYASAAHREDEAKILARRCIEISPLHGIILLSESEVDL
jgi:hypothetical protein